MSPKSHVGSIATIVDMDGLIENTFLFTSANILVCSFSFLIAHCKSVAISLAHASELLLLCCSY